MIPDKSTSELISDAVHWYRTLKTDFNDVDLLLRTQREFAARLYDFAGEVGALYKQRNRTEFQRKAAFARERQSRIAGAGSVAKAESEALVEVEALLNDEQQADSEYRAAYLLLEHGRDVLSSMVQHLSHLKQEKRAETYGQGSQST